MIVSKTARAVVEASKLYKGKEVADLFNISENSVRYILRTNRIALIEEADKDNSLAQLNIEPRVYYCLKKNNIGTYEQLNSEYNKDNLQSLDIPKKYISQIRDALNSKLDEIAKMSEEKIKITTDIIEVINTDNGFLIRIDYSDPFERFNFRGVILFDLKCKSAELFSSMPYSFDDMVKHKQNIVKSTMLAYGGLKDGRGREKEENTKE